MARKNSVAVCLMAALLVASCAPPEARQPGYVGEANKTTAGTLLGAAGGALLGSSIGGGTGRLMAVAAGTLLGAYIGGQVGESLDKADIEYARQAEMRAAVVPLRQQIVWSNPQTGHSGTVTPIREGRDPLGNYCREYQTTVTIGGRVEQAYGTACRQPDGSWKVIDS